ncbi:uncharacterized protein ARMOST_03427 [Armillaria ostoyae]|uniref:Uncharacterized protein n=1 Tax=Armillaria ostoyae TaxID=47428 RepID=A0A284QUE4_ARMOS|nr:uncharacterized protein ARMOST_03427 [Armillaria ostoyae]
MLKNIEKRLEYND